MIAFWLLILSICIVIILLSIHSYDEIHQLMAWLAGLLALVCIIILTPPLIKSILGLFLFTIGYKIVPVHSDFK